ncbi:uncharacterized protein LOC116612535 [Nematostella vectensis]|uniref:uncharacterized protein LOC116612535 n=1 Tax=Nematostella vectensis TaxID=45351 RepID=UPI002077440D|nr:uncharacterized protein LOC116612535 [Nematostella vectensis]XP_032229207.2 uncharacterized protein LOC116612535 [Nematostella vectensis]XP_032229208.2 uncharacterized protein LOC116612535 [Nematostella vectensis]
MANVLLVCALFVLVVNAQPVDKTTQDLQRDSSSNARRTVAEYIRELLQLSNEQGYEKIRPSIRDELTEKARENEAFNKFISSLIKDKQQSEEESQQSDARTPQGDVLADIRRGMSDSEQKRGRCRPGIWYCPKRDAERLQEKRRLSAQKSAAPRRCRPGLWYCPQDEGEETKRSSVRLQRLDNAQSTDKESDLRKLALTKIDGDDDWFTKMMETTRR